MKSLMDALKVSRASADKQVEKCSFTVIRQGK